MRGAIDVLWQVLAPILLTAGVGYVLARKVGLSPQGLSRAAFYVFSPCLLFDKFSHTQLSPVDLGRVAAFTVLVMAGSGLIAWLLSWLFHFDRPLTSAFMLCAIAGNTGNYGLPANQFAFGEAALEPAVIYYAVSTLVLSTVGVYLVARGRQSGSAALRNVLTVPLAYAGISGLARVGYRHQSPDPNRAIGSTRRPGRRPGHACFTGGAACRRAPPRRLGPDLARRCHQADQRATPWVCLGRSTRSEWDQSPSRYLEIVDAHSRNGHRPGNRIRRSAAVYSWRGSDVDAG